MAIEKREKAKSSRLSLHGVDPDAAVSAFLGVDPESGKKAPETLGEMGVPKYAQKTISELMDERDQLAKVLNKIANMPRDCGGIGQAIDEAEAVLKAMGLRKG